MASHRGDRLAVGAVGAAVDLAGAHVGDRLDRAEVVGVEPEALGCSSSAHALGDHTQAGDGDVLRHHPIRDLVVVAEGRDAGRDRACLLEKAQAALPHQQADGPPVGDVVQGQFHNESCSFALEGNPVDDHARQSQHHQVQRDQAPRDQCRRPPEEDGSQAMVWADTETHLPVRIETDEVIEGHAGRAITSDILFDQALDESLFSQEVPEGYKELETYGWTDRWLSRMHSAARMQRIIKGCLRYADENGGEWPDSLGDLADYGVDSGTLVNPRWPERENGYVYLKPPRGSSQSSIVLYEAYDLVEAGVYVGYGDGYIVFIRDESELNKRLAQ